MNVWISVNANESVCWDAIRASRLTIVLTKTAQKKGPRSHLESLQVTNCLSPRGLPFHDHFQVKSLSRLLRSPIYRLANNQFRRIGWPSKAPRLHNNSGPFGVTTSWPSGFCLRISVGLSQGLRRKKKRKRWEARIFPSERENTTFDAMTHFFHSCFHPLFLVLMTNCVMFINQATRGYLVCGPAFPGPIHKFPPNRLRMLIGGTGILYVHYKSSGGNVRFD